MALPTRTLRHWDAARIVAFVLFAIAAVLAFVTDTDQANVLGLIAAGGAALSLS